MDSLSSCIIPGDKNTELPFSWLASQAVTSTTNLFLHPTVSQSLQGSSISAVLDFTNYLSLTQLSGLEDLRPQSFFLRWQLSRSTIASRLLGKFRLMLPDF